MDGRALEAVKRIQYAYENAQHMKGIGFISEATYDNPLIYDLVFDMCWVTKEELQATTPEQFLSDWTDRWVISRYGVESENAIKAWDILLDTVYSGSSSPSQVILSTNPSLNTYGSRYSFAQLEEALELLYEDFDILSQSECYRYDLSKIMRQIVSNYATELCGELQSAYNASDLEAFRAKKAEFLAAFDLLNEVCATQQELLVGEWVGSAANWATDLNMDDFAYDAMTINAKTLITVWAPTTYLGTYAYRHYEGIIKDIYKPIWAAYLQGLEETLEFGSATTAKINYTKLCMEWIYTDWATQGYMTTADNSVANMNKVVKKVLDAVIYVDPINVGNIAYEKSVETNSERPDSPGAPGGGYASNVTDGLADTYWDGVTWEVEAGSEPYVIIDLEKEYNINKINVLNYVAGSRYYWYDIYVSSDKEDWKLVASREDTYDDAAGTNAGDDYIYETDKPVARYVKLVGLYNSSNEGFHVKEIRVYGYEVGKADYTSVNEALAKVPYDLSVYSIDSVNALQEAIDAVVYDLEEAKQDQVDAMAQAINDAITNLAFDKSALLQAINEAKALQAKDYTKASYTQLQSALQAAQNVYDTTQSSFTPIKKATTTLNDALAAMQASIIVEAYNANVTSKEGYLFAGYFEDEACMIPSATSENTYVKWIDEAVLTVKVQLDQNDTTSNVRFVSTVDDLQHLSVGFELNIYNGEELFGSKDVTSTTVYKSIVSNVDGTLLYNDPTIFSHVSQYFFTFNLLNIPSACYDYQLKVTPYYVTYDGTKVYGELRSISVNEVVELYNQ